MIKDFLKFLKHVRAGYLLFTSLLILGLFYGVFEIAKIILWDDIPDTTLQILYFSRGIVVSLSLMAWAAWTVYSYRALYKSN